jgi:hypothetical protein
LQQRRRTGTPHAALWDLTAADVWQSGSIGRSPVRYCADADHRGHIFTADRPRVRVSDLALLSGTHLRLGVSAPPRRPRPCSLSRVPVATDAHEAANAPGCQWPILVVARGCAQPGTERASASEGRACACEPPVPLHRQRTWVRTISSLYGLASASMLSASELSRYDAAAQASSF